MAKFSNIDPYNCTIEEGEAEVKRLDALTGFYETKQLALKKFINSVYGATASKYFTAHNTAVAESITLQGQDLNHFSENCVNKYFKGIFQNDTELHQKLGIKTEDAQKVRIGGGKVTETKPLIGEEFAYLNGDTESMTVAGDTDSVTGETVIKYDDHFKKRIQDVFTDFKYENNDMVLRLENGTELVPGGKHTIKTYQDGDIVYKPIKYLMRHKVTKKLYKLTSASGNTVIVTGDHSIMVERNGEIIPITVKELNTKTDKLIVDVYNKR